MSKILKALEKAGKEGTLEVAVDRSPADPVAPADPAPVPGRTRRRRKAGVVVTQAPDPEILRGVDPHVVVLHKPMSVISEQYRGMRSRIERANADGRIQTLVITSAFKGEGKSVTAANLASVFAQDATKAVLLVDADLRRPRIHKLLGIDGTPGLGDLLHGRATLGEVLQTTPFYGLSVVTAGTVEGHPAELLASPEFDDFIAQVRSQFDYIVLDTPPLHPISDVNFLADAVDGIVLVVRAHKTHRGLVRQAAETIPREKLLGTVLNRAESLRSGYGYGYGGAGYYYYKYY